MFETRNCPEESEEAFEWRVASGHPDPAPISVISCHYPWSSLDFFPQLTGVNYRQEFPNMVQNNIKRGEVEMKVEEQEDS